MMQKAILLIAAAIVALPGAAGAAERKAVRKTDPITDRHTVSVDVIEPDGSGMTIGCSQDANGRWTFGVIVGLKQTICTGGVNLVSGHYRIDGAPPISYAHTGCTGRFIYLPSTAFEPMTQASKIALDVTNQIYSSGRPAPDARHLVEITIKHGSQAAEREVASAIQECRRNVTGPQP